MCTQARCTRHTPNALFSHLQNRLPATLPSSRNRPLLLGGPQTPSQCIRLLDPSPPPLYIVTHTQHISGYISAPHPTVFWQPRAAAASAAASAADAAAAAARMSPPHPRVAAAMPCLRFTRWSSYQKPAHDTSLHAALQCRRRGRALVKMARQLLLRLHRWFLSRQPRASIRRLRANQPQLLPKITRK